MFGRLATILALLAITLLLVLPAAVPPPPVAPEGRIDPAPVINAPPPAPPMPEAKPAPPPVPPPAVTVSNVTLLLSSAPTIARAEAKWAKLVKAVPALAKLSPLTIPVGDLASGGYISLRLVGPQPQMASICTQLTAKGQFCEMRVAPPPQAPSIAPTPPSTESNVTMLLSSAKSVAAAKAKWARLTRSVPALSHLTPTLLIVGDLSRGGYVSLRVSGPQRRLANLCVLLTGKGQYCQLHGVLAPFHPPHKGN